MTVSFSVSNRLSLPFYHGMANIFILLLLSFRDFRLDFSLDLFLGNKHFPLALFLRFRFYGRLVYHWFSFGRKISLHLSISTIACTSFEWKMSMNRTQSDFPHLNDSPNLFCDRERNAVRRAFIFFFLFVTVCPTNPLRLTHESTANTLLMQLICIVSVFSPFGSRLFIIPALIE